MLLCSEPIRWCRIPTYLLVNFLWKFEEIQISSNWWYSDFYREIKDITEKLIVESGMGRFAGAILPIPVIWYLLSISTKYFLIENIWLPEELKRNWKFISKLTDLILKSSRSGSFWLKQDFRFGSYVLKLALCQMILIYHILQYPNS